MASEQLKVIDEERLSAYLAQRLAVGADLQIERQMAGHSNITFLLRSGENEWILRRPPLGPLPPTAHDVLREYRVLGALERANVRTPRTVLACSDESIIGAPFYLMERVQGSVIRDRLPAEIDLPESRRRIGEELVDALIELHCVDWNGVGLGDLGKPSGYLERQLKRWLGQWEHNRTRAIPALEEIGSWLANGLPESPPATLVHGDYKLDNVSFSNQLPATLVGIFDWEMATVGDPLADVGYMVALWFEPEDPEEALLGLMPITCEPGFISRSELIDRYEEGSGRRMTNIRFYQVLALWKLAILLEGSYKRFLAGATDDPFFERLATGVPLLAKWAWRVARS